MVANPIAPWMHSFTRQSASGRYYINTPLHQHSEFRGRGWLSFNSKGGTDWLGSHELMEQSDLLHLTDKPNCIPVFLEDERIWLGHDNPNEQ